MGKRSVEITVGLFVLFGVLALLALAVKVSGLTSWGQVSSYMVEAPFDNIGGLKVRASVRIAGVKIGRVSAIKIDPKTFQALVVMSIDQQYNHIPSDSSASILTQGLLGANYVSLSPGFDETSLGNRDRIQTTHSAMILENLIGQVMYSLKGNNKDKDQTDDKSKN